MSFLYLLLDSVREECHYLTPDDCLSVTDIFCTSGKSYKTVIEATIHYPGPTKEVITNRYGIDDSKSNEIPDTCKGKNFCTIKPPDYPEDHFNKMFKGRKQISQPTLVVTSNAEDTGTGVVGIGDRQGDPDEVDNCESKVTYEPLYRVRSKRGDWRTVVQAPQEDYIQRIRLEECKNANASCFTVFPSIPGIRTYCRQRYSDWELLVAVGKNGTEKIKASLPVCCSCIYTSSTQGYDTTGSN